MSHGYEDGDDAESVSQHPTADASFWEPGNYKWTTKRIEDGNRLCNEYVNLLKERAEIEKSYAKSLRGWAKKWDDAFEKGYIDETYIQRNPYSIIST
jgi:hypothetical protein